jgi:hypothetical protein
MGPETLLSLMPLNLEAEDLSVSNRLLIPILKQYIVGARLKYFTEEILPMIERVREKAHKVLNFFLRCSVIFLHGIHFLLSSCYIKQIRSDFDSKTFIFSFSFNPCMYTEKA